MYKPGTTWLENIILITSHLIKNRNLKCKVD